MGLSLSAKAAAFCRELGDDSLRALACQENMESALLRARESLQAGRVGPELEADLDSLNLMVARVEGQGLYPAVIRGYAPLPVPGGDTGAQWWSCPGGRCAGRGRVRPGQDPPVCAATGDQLTAGLLRE